MLTIKFNYKNHQINDKLSFLNFLNQYKPDYFTAIITTSNGIKKNVFIDAVFNKTWELKDSYTEENVSLDSLFSF